MARQTLIDAPGAGQWIMDRVQGVFSPGYDHTLSVHRDGRIIGGFALCQYLGNSISIHMAGEERHWCTRSVLWATFHYVFNQLGCYKVLAPLRSDQHRIIAMDMRAGFGLEAVIRDVYAPGVHLMVLGMTKASCPWIRERPFQLQLPLKVA